jgi:hypothetical protein
MRQVGTRRLEILVVFILAFMLLSGCVPLTPHTVSTPSRPSGPSSGDTGQSLSYSTGGASCNEGHPVEYRFAWGDGTYSAWSASASANKTWDSAGTCLVKAQARCAVDTSVVSGLSSSRSVTITAGSTASYRVTVKQITDEFDANEYAATMKYEGKYIAVSGYVQSIGIDLRDEPYVALVSDPDDSVFDPGVNCYFRETGPHPGLAELLDGDHVTIIAEFSFYSSLFETVYLEKSRIE